MHYTVQIQTTDPANLDGVTPLDLDAVTIDTSQPGRTIVVIPPLVLFGTIDPGEVLERTRPSDSGNAYVLLQHSIGAASGFPFPPGANIGRRAPGAAVQDIIADLEATQGFQQNNRNIFMPGHLLTFFTASFPAPLGPYVLNLLFKPLADADLRLAQVE